MHPAVHQVQILPVREHRRQVHLGVEFGRTLVQVLGGEAVVLDPDRMGMPIGGNVVGCIDIEACLGGRMGNVHGHEAQVFFDVTAARRGTAKQAFGHVVGIFRNGQDLHHLQVGREGHIHYGVRDVDGLDGITDALVGEGRGALRHLQIVEAVDVGHRACPAIGRHDCGTNQRLSIGVVELSAYLPHGGVVGLGLEPCIGGSHRGVAVGVALGAIDVPRLQVGLGAVLRRGTCRHRQGDVFPALPCGLVNEGLTFQCQGVADIPNTNVVARGPARLLHPVAEHEFPGRGFWRIDANGDFKRRGRTQGRQGLHGQIQGLNLTLQGSDLPVDVFASLLDALETRLEKGRGLHQPLQIDARVLDFEVLVLEKELLFAVKEHTPCLGVLNVLV